MNLVPCVKFGNHSSVICIFALSMVQPAVFTKSSAIMCKEQTTCTAVQNLLLTMTQWKRKLVWSLSFTEIAVVIFVASYPLPRAQNLPNLNVTLAKSIHFISSLAVSLQIFSQLHNLDSKRAFLPTSIIYVFVI